MSNELADSFNLRLKEILLVLPFLFVFTVKLLFCVRDSICRINLGKDSYLIDLASYVLMVCPQKIIKDYLQKVNDDIL